MLSHIRTEVRAYTHEYSRPRSESLQPQAFLLGREGVLAILRGICAGPFLAMLFVDRAWPWQASLPWLLAIALAPVGVICWQWAYWWVLRRMGAQGPALGRAFNWSLAPLWLGAPGLALFYLNDFTHHLLWHVALAKILAAYVIVGIRSLCRCGCSIRRLRSTAGRPCAWQCSSAKQRRFSAGQRHSVIPAKAGIHSWRAGPRCGSYSACMPRS